MPDTPHCAKCGVALTGFALDGVCSACLLERGLDGPNSPTAAATERVPSAVEAPGTHIGRYKLLQQIGAGGMGTVWMAEQTEPVRRMVALKVIKPGLDSKQILARFEAERQALALMDHPNIAKVLDAGSTPEGRHFFVMELVKGVPLTKYCDEQRLSIRERLELFMPVCQAIQHAHQKGVIHRDIKPGNVLVALYDGRPVPKVIDFGIAKATGQLLTERTLFTEFGVLIGTPEYMSPEQAELNQLDIDTRSDIYSLGVLLYELLTGTTPLKRETLRQAAFDEILRRIRQEEPPKPSTRLTESKEQLSALSSQRKLEPAQLTKLMRGDLDWIVMKALEKDRNRRYETANGLAMDLHRHLHNEAVLARPPSSAYRFQKLIRRNKLAVAAVACVTTALIIGAVVSTWQAVRATKAERNESSMRRQAESSRADEKRGRLKVEQQESITRQNLYVVDMNLARLALNQNDRQRAARLLERNRPAPGQEDLRNWEWRFLWAHSRSDERYTLGFHSNYVLNIALSSDAKLLASEGADGVICVWSMESGERLRTIEAMGALPAMAFSPDNRWFALEGIESVRVLDLAFSKEVFTAPLSGHLRSVTFSPDGRYVVWFSTAGEIDFWNLEENRAGPRFVVKPVDFFFSHGPGSLAFSPDGNILAIGEGDGPIQLIESPLQGARARNLLGHNKPITALAFSPDGKRLVSASWDESVRIWDVAEGRQLLKLTNHTSWVGAVAMSRDGSTFATASADQTIRIWELESGVEKRRLRGHLGEVWSVVMTPDGQRLISGGRDDAIKVWGTELNEDRTSVILPRGVRDVSFPRDGRIIAMLGESNEIKICDSTTLAPFQSLVADPFQFSALAFSPDGSLLATGDDHGRIQFFNSENWKVRAVLTNGSGPIGAFEFSSDGTTLTFTNSMGQLVLYSLAKPGVLRTIQPGGLGTARVSVDHRLCAVPNGQEVVLFNLITGNEYAHVGRHRDVILDAAFSPDAKTLATASADATVRLWEIATGREKAVLRGHRNGAFSVSFSETGERLITGGGEGMIKLWDLATLEETMTLESKGNIRAVRMSPDGSMLLALRGYKSWLAWRAPSWKEITEHLDPNAHQIAAFESSRSTRSGVASNAVPAIVTGSQISRYRRTNTTPIDLTGFYNARVDTDWLSVGGSGPAISNVLASQRILRGIEYDIRGIVQLVGLHLLEPGWPAFPAEINGIPVARAVARLHLLQATHWQVSDGTQIGSYIVHFVDGEDAEIPVVYGDHLRNWRVRSDRETKLKSGRLAAARRVGDHGVVRVFSFQWENPRPSVQIRSLDFKSRVTECAPFLLAITAE